MTTDAPAPGGRVGWTSVRVAVGAKEWQWLRLTVFEDGWIERPTFGRATSALGDTVRFLAVRLVLFVIAAAAAWGIVALSAAAGSAFATIVKYAGAAPLLLLGLWWLVRSRRRRKVQRQRWNGALEDLRRVRAAGIVPRRIPGTPVLRRPRSAAEAAERTTNVVLVPSVEVVSVIAGTTPDGAELVRVQLRSGAWRDYHGDVPRILALLQQPVSRATAQLAP